MEGKRYNGPKGPHPEYGNALSGAPFVVDGVTFRPYRRGILLYVRISDDFRIQLFDVRGGTTLAAYIDGSLLKKRFRSKKTAAQAAVAALKTKAVA